MHIAILGATSQIAKDLVLSMIVGGIHTLTLYARRPGDVRSWLNCNGLANKFNVSDYSGFDEYHKFDAIINFVGVGDPTRAASMGAAIFEVTMQYDDMALRYLRSHPQCCYIFLSSGAAYGGNFEEPGRVLTQATIPINSLQSKDWYGVAKLYAECRHRSMSDLNIIDVRVFNYFSHTQDIESKFLICDIVRAIRDKLVLNISADYIVRDYLNPEDFYQIIILLLDAGFLNLSIDCFSKAPISKHELLIFMERKFGLKYRLIEAEQFASPTGFKKNYYSENKIASCVGYEPKYTSRAGIERESELMLSKFMTPIRAL